MYFGLEMVWIIWSWNWELERDLDRIRRLAYPLLLAEHVNLGAGLGLNLLSFYSDDMISNQYKDIPYYLRTQILLS